MLETAAEWLDGNWFALLIGLFIVGMMLYGHSRGFVRLAVSLTAIVITLIATRAVLPKTVDFLKEHTGIEAATREYIIKATGIDSLKEEQVETRESQEQIIAGMDISKSLQKALQDNNNGEMWRKLGAERFQQYVAGYLGKTIIGYIGFVLLFVLISLLLHLGLRIIDIFTEIPVIHGLNQIAGAVLGLLEALIFVWSGFLLLELFETTATGGKLLALVDASGWLGFLYHYNAVGFLLQSFVSALL